MRGLPLFLFGALCGAAATYVAMAPRATPVARSADVARATPSQDTTASTPAETVAAPIATQSAVAPTANADAVGPASDATVRSDATAGAAGDAGAPGALLIPVDGVHVSQLIDTFTDARAAGRSHDAIDIMSPKGTRVLAAADGTVVKLFTSVRGGLTVYVFDPGRTIEYYYAHLDGYAPGLAEGTTLHRGDLVGFVGSTGDASPDAPHLHFEIAVLGAEKQWWRATDINPYPILVGRQSLADAVAAMSAPH